MAFHNHRQAILKLLNQVQIPTTISPKALSAIIGIVVEDALIVFSDKDLPIGGSKHNKALHITVDIKANKVPMVLDDNGSALNDVILLRTITYLGIDIGKFV